MIEEIKAAVTARDAADRYGLEIDRRGNALCPWHDDRRPSLHFWPDGHCYCFACNHGGDSIALTAQLFVLSMGEAARKLERDFGVVSGASVPTGGSSGAEAKRIRLNRDRKRWGFLADASRDADRLLAAYGPEGWDDPRFRTLLAAKCRAETELDRRWAEGVDRG